ncbi:MAG: HAMP domain-containing protein [Elusimicrobia bacterium]|nr:HAMP domain-containing protein [Elusimicrobiota bacterium]
MLDIIDKTAARLRDAYEKSRRAAVPFIERVIKTLPRVNIGLRYKLLVLFFLFSLLFLIFTLFTYLVMRSSISSQIESYQKAIVTSSQKIVEHYILNCQKSLLTLASEKSFREAVQVRDRVKLENDIKRVFDKHKTFSFLSVVDKKDDRLQLAAVFPASYIGILGHDEIHRYLKWNFSHPALRNSSVFEYRENREVIIVYPLKGALLIGGIKLDNLADLLDKIKPMSESVFILLDDKKDAIIGGAGRFEHVLEGEEGIITLDHEKALVYYMYNPVVQWWILLDSPIRIVYRSLNNLKNIMLLFIVLGIIIAFILALYFSKKVTLPISYLNKGARTIGEGNLEYEINLNTGDELEDLAKEFNKMSQELKKSYDFMEEKVRIATHDLQDAYNEIEDKNKELQEADMMKSKFLASMSHELRTPINAIIGFTSLLADGTYGRVSKKQKTTLHKVIKNTQHLLNLINDILDLSKIEAGRMDLHPEKFKLNLLIGELASTVGPLADEKKINFRIEKGSDIECFHDYTRLKQVIMNLLSNAIKFTGKGEVSIKTESDGERILIEVKDTGIGIKPDKLNAIFNEFEQADGSVTREYGGTGLGLSISRKLVIMMKGSIKVESEWEKGSVFRVELPVSLEKYTEKDV